MADAPCVDRFGQIDDQCNEVTLEGDGRLKILPGGQDGVPSGFSGSQTGGARRGLEGEDDPSEPNGIMMGNLRRNVRRQS